jgi:hypothetical protein
MNKIIRRTVTLAITETWTIVWADEPEAKAGSSPAAQDKAAAQAPLPAPSSAEATHLTIALPADEPASSPPDSDSFTGTPEGGRKRPKRSSSRKRRPSASSAR